jgi:hypothetical protein
MASVGNAPPANLERFLIVHLSLKETATGSGVEEDASLEELAESILYYFHAGQVADARESRTSSAPVRLAGLGTALWSFPDSLTMTEPHRSKRRFQFVRLSNSNLLLTRLDKDILGIAQFSKKALVTPQAMAANFHRQYRLYALFGKTSIQASCQHPSMKEVYRLYKSKRKAMQSSDETDTGIGKQMQEELDNLHSTLPINRLRTELGEHFDMFCAEWENIQQFLPASGRSVVHLTPPLIPGSQPLCALTQQMKTNDERENLVHLCEQNEAILGFSVFVNGLFEQTVSSGSILSVDVETAHLIAHHLSSILHRFPKECKATSAGFLRRTLGGLLQGECENVKGSFLSPPPLSMLSAMVQEIPFCTLDDKRIWTPHISLEDSAQPIQVCLYNYGNHAFVIYLDPASTNSFPQALSNFCESVNEVPYPKPMGVCDKWEKPGQTIIWIDRPHHRAILYSSMCTPRKFSADLYIDMRHNLASSLSLDMLLAVDDAMQHAIYNFPNRYEACTLLRHNWLVCRAQEGKELYVILDVKQYVTIQDVSLAMKEIEQKFTRISTA